MGRPFIDETGKRYGKLQVLKLSRIDIRGVAWFSCKCDCGNEIEVRGQCLRGGNNIACGCSKGLRGGIVNPHFVDKTGKRFGKFTVIKFNVMIKGQSTWLCRCDCGTEKIMFGRNLSKNGTKSCGCLMHLDKGEGAFNQIVTTYKIGARKRKLEWNLSKELTFKLIKSNCHYCDSPPSNNNKARKGYGDFIYNGIDRIDNTKGYVIDNVVPCCAMCNRMKLNYSEEQFRNQIKAIYDYWILSTRAYIAD